MIQELNGRFNFYRGENKYLKFLFLTYLKCFIPNLCWFQGFWVDHTCIKLSIYIFHLDLDFFKITYMPTTLAYVFTFSDPKDEVSLLYVTALEIYGKDPSLDWLSRTSNCSKFLTLFIFFLCGYENTCTLNTVPSCNKCNMTKTGWGIDLFANDNPSESWR